MHKILGKSFFCPMDKKMISLLLNGVLKNVLVCAQFIFKTSTLHLQLMLYHTVI